MASNTAWTDLQRFTETYKTIGDHEIKADILLSSTLQPGKHPLIIAYHGGYIISGARDHYPFMAAWLPSYAITASAIIVSPDYRLFPSATTSEILSDLEDLWWWVQNKLPGILSARTSGHEVDLDKILVEGNSAGGFCAAHLSLNHSSSIRASVLVYPMLDCIDPDYSGAGMRKLGLEPSFTGQALDDEIERIRQAGPVSARYQDSVPLVLALIEAKKFAEIFGNNEEHNPLHRAKGLKKPLPRTWILHGKDDIGVPSRCSTEFAAEVNKAPVDSDLILDVIDDEPSYHGFDATWTMNDEKLTKRLSWINEVWLA